ncbi:MAG: hypothetical protein H0W88_04565 [Parachlamydiaceae bacterium]|nr:hypothetical protein [Parachlamydiaceae bacterium]
MIFRDKNKCFISSLLMIFVCNILQAQGSSSMGSSTVTPATSIQSQPLPSLTQPGAQNAQKTSTPQAPIDLGKRASLARTPVPQTASYFHPGALVYNGGRWEGNDNLLNLSSNIGVYVEILKSPQDPIQISQEQLQQEVIEIFNKSNIHPAAMVIGNHPALPVFQIKLFVYPLEKGYAAYCEGRLFESVNPIRFNLDQGMAFQAITWQRQSLFIEPKDKIVAVIQQQVGRMAQGFADLFRAYQSRKAEQISEFN